MTENKGDKNQDLTDEEYNKRRKKLLSDFTAFVKRVPIPKSEKEIQEYGELIARVHEHCGIDPNQRDVKPIPEIFIPEMPEIDISDLLQPYDIE